MVDDAAEAGCECVKFQCHIVDDEMINSVVPGNAKESIWDIMSRCVLSKAEEIKLKEHVEARRMSLAANRHRECARESAKVPLYRRGWIQWVHPDHIVIHAINFNRR